MTPLYNVQDFKIRGLWFVCKLLALHTPSVLSASSSCTYHTQRLTFCVTKGNYLRSKYVGLRSAHDPSLGMREVLKTCGRLIAWDGTGTKCTPNIRTVEKKHDRSDVSCEVHPQAGTIGAPVRKHGLGGCCPRHARSFLAKKLLEAA